MKFRRHKFRFEGASRVSGEGQSIHEQAQTKERFKGWCVLWDLLGGKSKRNQTNQTREQRVQRARGDSIILLFRVEHRIGNEREYYNDQLGRLGFLVV